MAEREARFARRSHQWRSRSTSGPNSANSQLTNVHLSRISEIDAESGRTRIRYGRSCAQTLPALHAVGYSQFRSSLPLELTMTSPGRRTFIAGTAASAVVLG